MFPHFAAKHFLDLDMAEPPSPYFGPDSEVEGGGLYGSFLRGPQDRFNGGPPQNGAGFRLAEGLERLYDIRAQ